MGRQARDVCVDVFVAILWNVQASEGVEIRVDSKHEAKRVPETEEYAASRIRLVVRRRSGYNEGSGDFRVSWIEIRMMEY